MNPFKKLFEEKQAFVGFVVGGDGGIDYCVDCCMQLIEGGIDILEIGFPFSDPVADGPVIQRASQRALKHDANSTMILEIARRIRRKSSIPLVLFSYYNPILNRGNPYLKELNEAGFNAILLVDLPPPCEGVDSHPYYDALKDAGLYPIFLVTPSTDDKRLSHITEISEGFIYYACQRGTTGVRDELPKDIPFHISRIREKTKTPVVVGFGIANKKNAEAVLNVSDGFVVGSAFVKLMEKRVDPSELKSCSQSMDPRIKVSAL